MSDIPPFTAFVAEYFDALFDSNPSLATAKGIHDRDGTSPTSPPPLTSDGSNNSSNNGNNANGWDGRHLPIPTGSTDR